VVAEPHAKLREVDWKALTAIRADSSRSISGLISATGFSHKRNGDRVRTTTLAINALLGVLMAVYFGEIPLTDIQVSAFAQFWDCDAS
jgi:hypothetical protein